MIRTNTLKVLRVTRERKVRIITNTNDTYEYIEGATSNQRKKGTNYNTIDASYQVSYHLAKWLQRKRCFRNRPIRNKNCL